MSYPYFGPVVDKETRWVEIKAIIESGKAVRFTKGDTTKDVKSLEMDDGDLVAFRTENAQTKFVCWEAAVYEITAVDI